jgi:ABC-type dipeptide/oligopeptide/nickel transport system permease component
LLAFLARRLLFAAVAFVVLAAIVYAMFDVPHGLERVFFHLDFGVSCSYPGCPAVTVLWGRTWHADIYLLLGGLALGVTTGLAAAVFCATRPRTLATRAIETLAVIFYSLPVYLFALGLLLVFEPAFGLLPSPVFFHPEDYAAPLANPWRFFEAMLVPWILVAAPFGAVVMRLARVTIGEEIHSDYVRTAAAKGLSQRTVLRQAARPSYASVASLVGAWVPTFVTNMVLVEFVFFIPGFLGLSRRAFGQAPGTLVPTEPIGAIDIPMVQALALWTALLIVAVSALADVVLAVLDPRVRSTRRPVG